MNSTAYAGRGEAFAPTLFTYSNSVIVQIRRELCDQLLNEWLEEAVSILEDQLTYQILNAQLTNDLLTETSIPMATVRWDNTFMR